MTVRDEIVQSRDETGAWSREEGRHTNHPLQAAEQRVPGMSPDRAASPPAGLPRSTHASLSLYRMRDCSRSVHE